MKKFICITLSIAMIFTLLCVPVSFAADEGVENAILTAKNLLEISDDEYVIDDFSQYDGDYQLTWKSRDEDSTDSITATVSNGEIISYFKNFNRDYDIGMKLPAINKQEAQAAAEAFLKKVCPKIFETLILSNSAYERYGAGSYNFTYVRQYDGVPVKGQEFYVEVSADKGEVFHFTSQFDFDLTFEDKTGAVDFEKAKEAYIENFGYELKYIQKYDDKAKKHTAFLAYVPKDREYNSYIDALTGEKINLNDLMFEEGSETDDGAVRMNTYDKSAQKALGSAAMSKEEEALAAEIANLAQKDEVVSRVKKISEFKIDDSFVLTNYSIYKSYDGKYYASLDFSNETQKREDDEYSHKNVSYNLTDNRVEGYNAYGAVPYVKAVSKKTETAALKADAEKFINKYYADFVKNTEFSESKYSAYIISFDRFYDGVRVSDNGISFSYNEYTGELEGMNFSWNDVEFEPKNNIKTIDELYNKIITEDTLKLNYALYRKYTEGKTISKATKLVYNLENDRLFYDANTLDAIDYDGEVPEDKTYKYDDIENHYVKPYAEKLAELNIGLTGSSLKPDESITKRDYLMLVAMANNNFYYDFYSDSFAKAMISRGIIEKEDKDLDNPVSRIDAVRFMINNLGYKEIAEKNSIFNCPFTDIPENMVGYATLGAALKIVSDKNDILDAENNLTRADALIIIYNYLTRE
ncbi:MAG: hypothetical protein SPF92_02990 [Clostridia bacterium]|nr:hypothetical protein [Clostridia bacterium]